MGNTKKTDHNPVVKIIKDFKVPAEKVFDAWLDTQMLSRWMFGPNVRDEEIISLTNNPQPGGIFSYVVQRGDDEIDHKGTFREIDRPKRLVFTWGVDTEAGDESVVTITIESTEKGCRLTLVHDMDPKWKEYRDRTEEGWTYMLGKLEEIID